MNLHQDFKMAKQALIEQRWIFNRIQYEGRAYAKKDHITI